MTRVDFYELSRAVQDRVVDSTRGSGLPQPAASVLERSAKHWVWWAGAVAAALGLTLTIRLGFGRLGHPLAIAPVRLYPVCAGLLGVASFCLMRGAFAFVERARRHYPLGNFLFPSGVLSTQLSGIQVFPLTELEAAEGGSDGRLALRFAAGARFVFPVGSAEAASKLRAQVLEWQRLLPVAKASDNPRDIAALDPLIDSGFSSPFAPTAPLVRREPVWERLTLPLALALGLVLGAVAWSWRNAASEAALFGAARGLDTVEAYRTYLRGGGAHPEVSAALLPRAELRAAVAEGTVEAIERFAESHPSPAIRGDIAVALRKALLAELEQAKARHTLAALGEFRRRHVRHGSVATELRAATHAYYQRARERLRQVAGRDEARKLFDALIAYAEEHGPRVSVRFVRRLSGTVEKADALVKRSAFYVSAASVPSLYFNAAQATRRERLVVSLVVDRLQREVSTDILAFELQPSVEPAAPVPKAEGPTLLVEHEVSMKGSFSSPDPRGIFPGIEVTLDATFLMPGQEPLSRQRYQRWRAPRIGMLKRRDRHISDVYDDMTDPSFEAFGKELISSLLREP